MCHRRTSACRVKCPSWQRPAPNLQLNSHWDKARMHSWLILEKEAGFEVMATLPPLIQKKPRAVNRGEPKVTNYGGVVWTWDDPHELMCWNTWSTACAAISGGHGTFRRVMLIGGRESLEVDLEIDNLTLLPNYFVSWQQLQYGSCRCNWKLLSHHAFLMMTDRVPLNSKPK